MYLGQRGIWFISFPTSVAPLSCLYDIFSFLSYFAGPWPTAHLVCQRGHWEQSPLTSKWPPLRWRRNQARPSLVMPLSMTLYLQEYSKKGYMNKYPIPIQPQKTILKLKTEKFNLCITQSVHYFDTYLRYQHCLRVYLCGRWVYSITLQHHSYSFSFLPFLSSLVQSLSRVRLFATP